MTEDNKNTDQCTIQIVMPSVIHTNKNYDVIWHNDTISKGKNGNMIISMLNGATPKIKQIKESIN